MAFPQFKRIMPAWPTDEEMADIYQRMLDLLMKATPEEVDEYLEPAAPYIADSQFIEHRCPECGGWRLGYLQGAVVGHAGHYAHCKRWLKSWKFLDCFTIDRGNGKVETRYE